MHIHFKINCIKLEQYVQGRYELKKLQKINKLNQLEYIYFNHHISTYSKFNDFC